MKAIEYVERFKSDLDSGVTEKSAIENIVKGLLSEISLLAKVRKVKTDAGMAGVVQEITNKWKAIARKLKFNEDGFEFLLEKATGVRVTAFGRLKKINDPVIDNEEKTIREEEEATDKNIMYI